MDNEASRLRELFDLRATVSQAEFGRRFEIGSSSMVWQYLNARRKLNLDAAIKFAQGLQVKLSELSPRLAAELDRLAGRAVSSLEEYARIPCVTVDVSATGKKFTTRPLGHEVVFIAFRNDWLRSRSLAGASLIAAECSDDGMRPTLAQGDLIVINTADTALEDAAVYAVGYEGSFLVRRLFRDEGAWWLTCDNGSSQRFMRKRFGEKHCFMLGKVVHRQSETL